MRCRRRRPRGAPLHAPARTAVGHRRPPSRRSRHRRDRRGRGRPDRCGIAARRQGRTARRSAARPPRRGARPCSRRKRARRLGLAAGEPAQEAREPPRLRRDQLRASGGEDLPAHIGAPDGEQVRAAKRLLVRDRGEHPARERDFDGARRVPAPERAGRERPERATGDRRQVDRPVEHEAGVVRAPYRDRARPGVGCDREILQDGRSPRATGSRARSLRPPATSGGRRTGFVP